MGVELTVTVRACDGSLAIEAPAERAGGLREDRRDA